MYFGVAQMVERLLVSRIRLLQFIHHQIAMAQAAPDITIVRIQVQNTLEVLDCFGKLLLGAKDTGNGVHGGDRVRVLTESIFIRSHSPIQVSHQFGDAA